MESQFWVLDHREGNKQYRITTPVVHAGRKINVDISCMSPQVSRNQATFIQKLDGSLHVQDNESLNGTFINRIKIKPNILHQLHVNDEVGLGLHSGTPEGDELLMKYVFIVKKFTPDAIINLNADQSSNFDMTNASMTSQQLLNVLNFNSEHNVNLDLGVKVKVEDQSEIQGSIVDGLVALTAKEYLTKINSLIPIIKLETNQTSIPVTTNGKDPFGHKLLDALDSRNEDDLNQDVRVNVEDKVEIINASENVRTSIDDRSVVVTTRKNNTTNISNEIVQANVMNHYYLNQQPHCSHNVKVEPLDVDAVINNTPSNDNGYTIENGCIIINDNDDDFPCSQLLHDVPITNNAISDSMFCSIKKELEEFDRLPDGKVYAFVNLSDSDDDQSSCSWLYPDAQTNSEINCGKERENSDSRSPENSSSNLKNTKYVVPPIIPPHIELKSGDRRSTQSKTITADKRKSVEIDIDQPKKIKTQNFYNSKSNQTSKRKRAESLNKERRQSICEIRKKKLKEIAEKPPEKKEQTVVKVRTATSRVKVSNSRGTFLTTDLDMPSTSRGRSTVSSTIVRAKNKLPLPDSKLPPTNSAASSSKYSPHNNNNVNSTPFVPKSVIPVLKTVAAIPKAVVTVQHSTSTQPTNNNGVSKSWQGIEDILLAALNWNTIWFLERKDNKKSPPISKQPLSRMSASFATYSDYYKTVRPLLELELWNYMYKELDNAGADPRKKVFLAKIESEQKYSNYTELQCMTYISRTQTEDILHIREEDVVVFRFWYREENQTYTSECLGYASDVLKKHLQASDFIDAHFGETVGLTPHALLTFKLLLKSYNGQARLEKYINIRVIASLVPSTRVIKSVKYLEHSSLCQHILKPTLDQYKLPTIKNEGLFTQDKLNRTQYQAVVEATHVCLRKEPGIYLIQGPPGTGKTTVIINIILEVLFRISKDERLKSRCILVVAPSNGAVDELVLRLIHLKSKLEGTYRKSLKLVRLGPKDMIHPGVRDYSLHEIAKRNINTDLMNTLPKESSRELFAMQQNISSLKGKCTTPEAELELNTLKIQFDQACRKLIGRSYNKHFKKNEEVVLNGARIICTTLSSCIGVRMEEVFGGSKKITCCIVDEATQSTEQETLIPLKLGIDKMVLVGDPNQLPAVTLSIEAKNCCYGQSLFSRIMHNFKHSRFSPIKMLVEQYRMHPVICEFPSKTYYDGKLRSGDIVRNRKSQLNVLQPYLIFNFKMNMVNSQEYQNITEINCVLKLLDAISLIVKDKCEFTVGVITPYNNQKEAIKKEMNKRSCRSNVTIAVNTVDGFQGQEKDIIILSCVRNSGNNFVSDEHRLNVAITRAKYALFVIGSDNLFKSCTVLGRMYDDAKQRCLTRNLEDSTSALTITKIIRA